MAGGLLRFAGPVGLLVTAATGIFGGVTAAMDEYKKTGDLGKAIKEGSAGALSALTFGLISQETFSDAFTAVGDMWDSAVCGTAELADKAWQGVKSILPTAEGMKRTFNKLGKDLSPLKEIHIPEEFSFSEIKKSVSSAACALNESFKNITGIDVGATLKDIGDGVANAASKLHKGFEDITGINLSETFSSIKDSVLCAFDDIEIPSFDDIKNKVSDIGSAISSGFDSVGSFVSGIFGSGDIVGDLGVAVKEGLYMARHGAFSGDSALNREALKAGVESGKIDKSILEAIIEDDDINKKDMEFMEKLLDHATKKGSLFTHDQGLHDRFDRIFGTVNDRSGQILASGISRGMMGMGGGGSLISAPINNINNSRSDTTVTSTELTHPSPLLNSVNIAA